MTSFHEVLFPLDIALKSAGGPQRRTDVVTLGSGAEERNAHWSHSRRRYDAGYGVKTFAAFACTNPCPLYPRKRAFASHKLMSALGQKRICAAHSITSS